MQCFFAEACVLGREKNGVALSLARVRAESSGSVCGEITFFSSIVKLLSLSYGQQVQSDFGNIHSFHILKSHKVWL